MIEKNTRPAPKKTLFGPGRVLISLFIKIFANSNLSGDVPLKDTDS
jgi:hypothetical protein